MRTADTWACEDAMLRKRAVARLGVVLAEAELARARRRNAVTRLTVQRRIEAINVFGATEFLSRIAVKGARRFKADLVVEKELESLLEWMRDEVGGVDREIARQREPRVSRWDWGRDPVDPFGQEAVT